ASKKILREVALLKAVEARNAISLDSVLKRLQDLRGGTTTPSAPTAPATPHRAAAPAPAERPPPTRAAQHAQPVAPAPAAAPDPLAAAPEYAFAEHPAPAPEAPASNDLETLWARLVEAAGRASPFVRSYLLEAHPVSFNKNLFVIGFAPE